MSETTETWKDGDIVTQDNRSIYEVIKCGERLCYLKTKGSKSFMLPGNVEEPNTWGPYFIPYLIKAGYKSCESKKDEYSKITDEIFFNTNWHEKVIYSLNTNCVVQNKFRVSGVNYYPKQLLIMNIDNPCNPIWVHALFFFIKNEKE